MPDRKTLTFLIGGGGRRPPPPPPHRGGRHGTPWNERQLYFPTAAS
ncbi:hypothetical protein [Mesorhizobium ciceri]